MEKAIFSSGHLSFVNKNIDLLEALIYFLHWDSQDRLLILNIIVSFGIIQTLEI
jgi:hypothetical protein